jgi:hypothetical protein
VKTVYKVVEGEDGSEIEKEVNELAKKGFKAVMMSVTTVPKGYQTSRYYRTILMEKVEFEEGTPYRG